MSYIYFAAFYNIINRTTNHLPLQLFFHLSLVTTLITCELLTPPESFSRLLILRVKPVYWRGRLRTFDLLTLSPLIAIFTGRDRLFVVATALSPTYFSNLLSSAI